MDRILLRERLLGAAEAACIAWALVGHAWLGIFPPRIPILVTAALVAVRVARASSR